MSLSNLLTRYGIVVDGTVLLLLLRTLGSAAGIALLQGKRFPVLFVVIVVIVVVVVVVVAVVVVCNRRNIVASCGGVHYPS